MGDVYRLKGPAAPIPEVTVSTTKKQGGGCKGARTLDLILTFDEEPKQWLDSTALPEGPCSISAQPLDNGKFEMRFSYIPADPKANHLEFLPFISTQRLIIDHWASRPQSKLPLALERPKKNKPAKNPAAGDIPAPKIKTLDEKAVAQVNADSFENQSSWEKILGSAAVALDFNSPELDRFRSKDVERNTGISSEPVERLLLKLPMLDLPPMESPLDFAEERVVFTKFQESDLAEIESKEKETDKATLKARAATVDGMNLMLVFVERGEWLKAYKSLDILERSKQAEWLPVTNAKWWALKGLLYLRMGQDIGDKGIVRKAIETWRDGLRRSQGWGGESQEYLEYMALETVRNLFNENLVYAAASVLSWARRYSWTAAAEERFGFLRGESFYRLGLYDEAKSVFSDFVNARKEIPVTSFADRRLVSAAAYRLGDLEIRDGNDKGAIEQYTRAFVEGPRVRKFSFESNWLPEDVRIFPYVLFNRAEAYARLKQEDAALRDLRAFLFVAPSHPDAGLVYYRIGDLLESLGANEEKVMGAWRECVFKVPRSLGGRLCSARKAAKEMHKTDRAKWPRLIADIEDAVTEPKEGAEKIRPDELKTYLNLLIADAFIQANEPYQSLLRLDPLQTLEMSPHLRMWFREYLITSIAGYGNRLVRERKFEDIIKDYGRRERVLFLNQTRHEVLWNVVQAYKGLGLLDPAMTTLEAAEKVRARIDRQVIRPYDPATSEWVALRASIEIELLAHKKIGFGPERPLASLEKLNPDVADNERLWIRYSEVVGDAAAEANWWAKLEERESLSWKDLRRFNEILRTLKRDPQRRDLLERRVGSWFKERDKLQLAETPPMDLLMELFELRASLTPKDSALAIADYLTALPDEKLGPVVTKPMMEYKKGKLLLELGRDVDARQSFERAKQLAPDSVWGKLASSAQKEMNGRRQSTGSR